MPPSRFASPIDLRSTASIRAALAPLPGWALFCLLAWWGGLTPGTCAYGQQPAVRPALGDAPAAQARARRFLAGRSSSLSTVEGQRASSAPGARPAPATSSALARARRQQASLLAAQRLRTAIGTADLTAAWQPLGPEVVESQLYGAVTGRITSIALDPNDSTGNTVWLGTTGGGVWKSSNAAGPLAAASFAPLTDTLSVFSANEGAATVPSLSIGAVAVQPATTGVVLAGTGDPNDATDSYYGEGILRSADGGQTWTLAIGSRDGANGEHSFAGLATEGLAWSTATPTLVVAAMGVAFEGQTVDAPNASSVPGLYFSTDAGVTWGMATVYDGNQLVQSPEPANSSQSANNATAVVWDAQRGLFLAALSFHGYYSSPDGQTWRRLSHQPGTALTSANCPVNPGSVGSPNCPIARGALAVQPATGDLYALSVDVAGNDQGLWQDLCNAGSGGTCANSSPGFANRLDGGALEVGQGTVGGSTAIPQGTYNLALAAAPVAGGATVLFAGTIDLYRCSLAAGATSCTLRNTTNAADGCNAPAAVAPAQHALAALGESTGGPLLYLGNDGGLWRSADGVAETGSVCAATDKSHFDNLNPAIGVGGSLAEVVGFAQDPSAAGTLVAGLGENGSASTANATALIPWPQLSEGEGGFPQIDPVTPANWYVAVGAGVDLSFCDLGAACAPSDLLSGSTVGEPQVDEDAALLDPPTLLDPQNPQQLITATCRVWRGPAGNGAAWSAANALSPALDGSGTPCTLTSSLVRSMGAGGPSGTGTNPANVGSEVLYAGMAGLQDGGDLLGGHLFVTKAGNTDGRSSAWTDAAYGAVTNSSQGFNAAGFDISAVAPDAHDPTGGTVYVTIMGFGPNGDVPHVYRSTDFGAHWTDVSANLPNAPADSLVVDPNDANTVYLAMDTGVYVTRAMDTCAAQNCWSPLGTGLPNAPVTQLAAGAAIPTGDGRRGMLRASTYGRGLWQIPLLTALPVDVPGLAVSPTALTFPAQAEATAGFPQTVTVTSTGSSPVTISSLALAGDFVESDNCSGQTLPVGSTCAVSVQFAPTATGARTGLLTVYANIAGGQATVALNGTATAPAAVVLTPLDLSFPSTVVNGTAATEIITVSNTGDNPATLQTPRITGDFAIVQSTCTGMLPSQTGCSLVIRFTPTGSGTRTGVLTVTDSAGTQTAQLSGVGEAPATDTLSPLSLTFPQAEVGTISAPQQVTLTNAGDVPLILITGSITAGDFTAANGCSSSLAPHSSCAVSVTFVPTAVGTRTGTLTITDQVRFQTVSLIGTAVAPPGVSLTPTIMSFAGTGVGLTAPDQTLTLTNNGGLPLTISATKLTGDFAMGLSTCGTTLNAGSACTFDVLFTPTAAGERAGTLVLSDNAPSGTQTVNLAGTGIDFSLAPNGSNTVTVTSGSPATFPLQLTSLAGLSGSVALSCSGAPANSLCAVSPSSPALGGTVLVNVVVQTGTVTAELRRPGGWTRRQSGGLFLAVSPWLFWGVRRRRSLHRRLGARGAAPGACLLLLAGLLGGIAGCGAGRVIPLGAATSGGSGSTGTAPSQNPTPPGNYALTVTGTTAGVSHAVNLTLTVQ